MTDAISNAVWQVVARGVRPAPRASAILARVEAGDVLLIDDAITGLTATSRSDPAWS
jgi:hypothetical protein